MNFQNSNPGTDSPQMQSLGSAEAHNLLTSFNTFLTICIHNILFYRSIYPSTTFLSAKAYNLPVHQNRHPKVCSWIQDAVDAVGAQLAVGDVERIAVVIHAALKPATQKLGGKPPEGKPKAGPASKSSGTSDSVTPAGPAEKPAARPGAVLERWMFDVSAFPAWAGGAEAMRDFGNALQAQREDDDDGEAELVEEAAEDDGGGDDDDDDDDADEPAAAFEDGEVNWAEVDEQFRGAIARIAHTAEKMGSLPKGCTFTVAVELKEGGKAPIGHPQPWIPSPPNLQIPNKGMSKSKGKGKAGKDVGGKRLTPIRSVTAGPIFFECWVEEGKAKIDALSGTGQGL